MEGDRIVRNMKMGGLALIVIVIASLALVGCSGSGNSLDTRFFGIWRATAAWVNGVATDNLAGAWGYDQYGDALQVVFLNTGRCSDQAYDDGDPIANEAGTWSTSSGNLTIDWDNSGPKVHQYEFTNENETCRLTYAIGGDVIVMRLEKQ